MEPIINFIKSFAEELNSRAKSRWLTCLIMSWLIYNWKRFVTLIFTDNRTPDLVQSTISDMIRMGSTNPCCVLAGYGIIIAISAFWIYGRPIVDTYIDSLQHRIKKKFRVEELSTIMKRENMNTHEYYMNQQQYDSHYKREADRLQQELEEANGLIARHNLSGKNYNKLSVEGILESLEHIYLLEIKTKEIRENNDDSKKKIHHQYDEVKTMISKLKEIQETYKITRTTPGTNP